MAGGDHDIQIGERGLVALSAVASRVHEQRLTGGVHSRGGDTSTPSPFTPFTAPRVSQAAVNAGCFAILPRAEQPAPTFLGFSEVTDGHAPVQVRLVGLSRSFGVNRPTRLHDGQARRAKPHFIPSHSPMPSQSRPASRCDRTMRQSVPPITENSISGFSL